MDYAVIWTRPAISDLRTAIAYLADMNPRAAEEVRADLMESVKLLGQFPEIGPVYERNASGRIREIVCREYRIFYRINETAKQIEVLRIWHGSRREPRFSRN